MTSRGRESDLLANLHDLGNWVKRKLRRKPWMVDLFSDPAEQGALLADRARCEAFREAIQRTVKPGDVVVDLGAGTGLLSFFALEAGARHVYAIEFSRIARTTQKLIEANGFQKRITLIRKMSTRARLPELGDVLISETLSAFCFDAENTIAYMHDARKRLLKPDARIIPESAETFLVPISSDAFGLGNIPEIFYGINFQAFREKLFGGTIAVHATDQPYIELSPPGPAHKIDFRSDTEIPRKAIVPFRISRDGRLDGFLGWFEATLCPGVTLANSPNLGMSSWGQLYFPLLEQPAVRGGEPIILELNSKLVGGVVEWNYKVLHPVS
ncbi:MAG TPA: 50S ribosomal protein L11 methyltransferase [Candidatus Eisenbacteria bacterium]|nr:50S ribosomal protein L11 methyltransferase [Candidatus Eisenbacteria bacterium]